MTDRTEEDRWRNVLANGGFFRTPAIEHAVEELEVPAPVAEVIVDCWLDAFVEAGTTSRLDSLGGDLDSGIAVLQELVTFPEGLDAPNAYLLDGIPRAMLAAASFALSLLGRPFERTSAWLYRDSAYMDEEDYAFLIQVLREDGFEIDAIRPQGGGAPWHLVWQWMGDDALLPAFKGAVAAASGVIVKHFLEKRKKPPEQLVVNNHGDYEAVSETPDPDAGSNDAA